MYTIKSPTTYQGGKVRLAPKIIDSIAPNTDKDFYDICSGSGAITCELLSRGFLPKKLHMVEAGIYGEVWKALAEGSFDLDIFRQYCESVPKDETRVKAYIQKLAALPPDVEGIYVYPLLQAAAFGGRAIWSDGKKWKNIGFKDAGRNKPMAPSPGELYTRFVHLSTAALGVNVHVCDALLFDDFPKDSSVYIDPPYKGVRGYGYELDLDAYLPKVGECWVSYGEQFGRSTLLKEVTSSQAASSRCEYLNYLEA